MAIWLFNWFGYRVLTCFLESEANHQLELQLDNDNYDETQLVSIKIPVTYLPYYNNSKTFERVDGQVEIQGIQYKYVKRRIYNDSLELLCIPNAAAMKLQAAKNEFFKFINDLHHTTQSKSENTRPPSAKNILADYDAIDDLFKMAHFYTPIAYTPFPWFIHFPPRHYLIVEQPPENC